MLIICCWMEVREIAGISSGSGFSAGSGISPKMISTATQYGINFPSPLVITDTRMETIRDL
jgi:hypothetical protein